MRRILFAVIGCFTVFCAHAAQIVNVDYVHKLIAQEWDISIPIKADSPMQAANMKYLLTAVDVANEILNGEKTTDYGNGEFATLHAADTVATNQAVQTLVKKEQKHEFTLTTTPTNRFEFSISAAGTFYIDWGDGKTETITKPDTTNTTYSHNYATAKTYTIGLSGQATGYYRSDPELDLYAAAISFYSSASKIASIDGSLGAIFGTLSSDTNNQPLFYSTFSDASNMTGSIPSDLFAGISGIPASYMFTGTFAGCSGLTSIPENLFAGTSGAPASYNMFAFTFSGCSGLTSIPAGLFAGISGEPAEGMFSGTFRDCSKLTSIPAGLFAGISGEPAESMFDGTFSGCSGLTSIPENLFAGISGKPAISMFDGTFSGCSGLTSIPENLFAGISGKPAISMFDSTFSECSGLTSIPAGLFAGISGEPAEGMFSGTFYGCSGLTSIPENLFGNISGTAQSSMFMGTFFNCTSLTGSSARINGQYLYEIWPDATSDQVGGMYYNATKLDDYRCIPTVWGGGGEDCSATPAEFTLTTTSDTTSFSFSISAAGEFVVDWGDGTVETITKANTTDTTYTHNYATADEYTIGIGGQATAYNTSTSTAAISFYVNSSQTKIASIDGSLGAIFGTLPDATEKQPRFYETFYYATNMTGSIPSDLFAGISGAPASNMFESTFSGCSGLTGAIPDGLFAGISGAPAYAMFYSTFSGCSGLTGAIPAGLFAGISGAPASSMFQSTFYGCSRLTAIPENLFGNISGTAQGNMFMYTFYNCTSLTGPSVRINGKYLYEIWNASLWATYKGCTGLSDYSSIPYGWLDD
ncbi:MAG: hypothetical protein IJE79_04000 [Alphaproteobacteria bacterium]|nr:hypothetical protein [Alphaproteobacteria bacterium]